VDGGRRDGKKSAPLEPQRPWLRVHEHPPKAGLLNPLIVILILPWREKNPSASANPDGSFAASAVAEPLDRQAG